MLGVQFDDKHSYKDWHLKWYDLNIALPEHKTHTVEIPGRDGNIDLTEALTGTVKYSGREISMSFDRDTKSYDEWQRTITDVSGYLHGQRRKIILDTDKEFYYLGRVKVVSTKTEYLTADFTITVDVEPYKYKIMPTVVPIELSGQNQVVLRNSRMPVSPVITTTAACTIIIDGVSHVLGSAGVHRVPEFLLLEGENLLTITGTGSVVFEYQEGEL